MTQKIKNSTKMKNKNSAHKYKKKNPETHDTIHLFISVALASYSKTSEDTTRIYQCRL